MTAVVNLPELNDDQSKLDFATTALMEIVTRLQNDDSESALSVAKGCLIGLQHGSNSSEFKTFVLIEDARFSSMNGGEQDA